MPRRSATSAAPSNDFFGAPLAVYATRSIGVPLERAPRSGVVHGLAELTVNRRVVEYASGRYGRAHAGSDLGGRSVIVTRGMQQRTLGDASRSCRRQNGSDGVEDRSDESRTGW